MPLPIALQRSYMGPTEAIQDQYNNITRPTVQRGLTAEQEREQGGMSALSPVNASDDKPNDTISSDVYTGGDATKLRPIQGSDAFASAVSRRLGLIGDIGSIATSGAQQNAFNRQQGALNDQMNGATLGYSLGEGMTTAMRKKILDAAGKYVGTPYKWGGAKPGGFDCSGLIDYVYSAMGINMPRVSQQQAKMGTITRDIRTLQPGDFIAWGNPAHHIAIYAGNGMILESPHTGANVRYRKFNMNESGIYGVKLKGF
jgi:hypothetical protein